MAKTALITGATGLLGRQVLKVFDRENWNTVGTGFSRAKPPTILKVDLASEPEVAKALNESKPQVVIHCAANRFPDKCDNDPEGTRALNIAASASLAKLCAEQSIFLVYISTDYVFPGTEETKYEGEKAVLAEYEKAGKSGLGVVLRVPVLYGEGEPEESAVGVLVNSVWKAQEKDANIKMDHWALRYPTNTEDVGRVLSEIATKYLESKDPSSLPRVLQFSSEDKFTKYEICQLFAEILGLPLDGMVANTEGNDPNASVQRPYDCHLSTKALKDLGINVATMDFTGFWKREMRAFRK
ncbi:RmlD substrate binding domain-containing protein [Botrytis cinerea]